MTFWNRESINQISKTKCKTPPITSNSKLIPDLLWLVRKKVRNKLRNSWTATMPSSVHWDNYQLKMGYCPRTCHHQLCYLTHCLQKHLPPSSMHKEAVFSPFFLFFFSLFFLTWRQSTGYIFVTWSHETDFFSLWFLLPNISTWFKSVRVSIYFQIHLFLCSVHTWSQH